MLKKSLKIGSILLLIFAMVAFIGCDTGSDDTDPEETPVGPGPGPDDPNVPPPPVETVTGVTITEATQEMLAGEKFRFKAEVSGTAADKTVKWSVAIADVDYENVKEDGTTITDNKGAGELVIDGGQKPGTILTVTAVSNADPSQFAESTVKVVKPGPRLAWTPNFIPVSAVGEEGTIDEDAISTGRLLEIYGKDIRIFDGEYIEGQHYSLRRVDNLNNSIQGGTVTVTGSADEGTITVTLNGNVIGDKGPVGVTLFQSVLEGADAAEIDLEASELVYNVTSDLLITSLSAVSDFAEPLKGSTAPTTVTTPASMTGTVTWTGLTSGEYTHRTPAVATITLRAAAGYKFYTLGISESTIKSKFANGSPEVAILTKSSGTLKFTLTYTIKVKTINGTLTGDDYVLANFGTYLGDLVVEGLVEHNHEAPTTLRVLGESPYYNLDKPVEWTGLTGKNFFGGKVAVATITIPAKPGYTFEGTDLKIYDHLVGRLSANPPTDRVFDIGSPAGDIISAGDSLVFTLSYYVPKYPIIRTDITLNVSGKLPVPVIGQSPVTNLTVSKNAPFTGGSGSVVWSGLSTNNKFTTRSPKATVTLLAKDGYEFSTGAAGFPVGQTLANGDVALIATSQTVTFNLGNKLVVEVLFGEPPETVNILALPGLVWPANNIHGTPAVTPVTSSEGLQIKEIGGGADNSEFEWTGGLDGSSNIHYGSGSGKLYATAVLKPKDGFTFAGLATSDANKTKITEIFTMNGITEPESVVLTIDGNYLVIDLVYPIAQRTVAPGKVAWQGTISNLPSNVIHLGTVRVPTGDILTTDPEVQAIGPAAVNSTFTWGTGVSSGKFDYTANNGEAVATLVVKPGAYFTFEGFDTLNSTAITYFETNFVINSNQPDVTLATNGRNLVVTLEYNIARKILTGADLPSTDFNNLLKIPAVGDTLVAVGHLSAKTNALVTVVSPAWATVFNTGTGFFVAGTGTYTFTVVPKPGYTLDGSSNTTFTDLIGMLVARGFTGATATPNATDSNSLDVTLAITLP
jgi:hypothetical protein